MPEPDLIRREREAVRNLLDAISERDRRETELLTWDQNQKIAIEKQARNDRQKIDAQFHAGESSAREEIRLARESIPRRLEDRVGEVATNRDKVLRQVQFRIRQSKAQAEEEANRARWEATTLFEASNADAETEREKARKQIAESEEALAELNVETDAFLKSHRMVRTSEPLDLRRIVEPENREGPADPIPALEASIAEADRGLAALEKLFLPRLFRDANVVVIYILIALIVTAAAVLATDPLTGVEIGAASSLLLGTIAALVLYRVARRQVAARFPGLSRSLRDCAFLVGASQTWIARRCESRLEEFKQQHTAEVRHAERKLAGLLEKFGTESDEETARIDKEARERSDRIRQEHEDELASIVQTASKRSEDLRRWYDNELRELEDSDRARREDFQSKLEHAWSGLVETWRTRMDNWNSETRQIHEACEHYFLNWSGPSGVPSNWSPPREPAPAMRFGDFTVDLGAIPRGLPRDERLRNPGAERVTLPALAPMPEGDGAFVVRAYGDGREPALDLLRAMMLRMLTSVPPGKVRFTIIDPVGLGQNFAGFMHLADFDEALVGSRIWTEDHHIENKLADLTEHMEKVIQKYLRNEFETIQDYNEHAGEVAEPYRVVVIANFPANFNEAAVRRLLSICQSGPRCGVYPLIMVDERETIPAGLTMADLERGATILSWRDGKLSWKDNDFGGYPLTLDRPPVESTLTSLLRIVGEQAKEASRVEVPFEVIVPGPDEYWTGDSRREVVIPLGRVGANKLQDLRLGRGTSQHVLIAGRTGSGKSTLLHAMIVSASLRYSPDQVELYLIDFKKGVEFKTYASHHLPHARVVAIESEREFGLSVLQRLDVLMKERGDVFRNRGVQDLGGYRDSMRPGDPAMPRILLIVDEFQEFFVDDDRTAQDAALLLDRLVRQGRAFGIHVLLGSQSLGGAFTLARSTMGQMAVRVALQCSESDAHLILNEENTAARLLSRPGEAIYNDANGMIEGNNFFQVVWLADNRRDDYLSHIKQLDHQNGAPVFRPQIVFEGQVAADLTDNHVLRALINAPSPRENPRAPMAWLGDAVAIKDPTAATFRRQSGANLLVVGQNPEPAMGLFLGAVAGSARPAPDARGRRDLDADNADRLPRRHPRRCPLRRRACAFDGGPAGHRRDRLARRGAGDRGSGVGHQGTPGGGPLRGPSHLPLPLQSLAIPRPPQIR